jgi:hypothetical protein
MTSLMAGFDAVDVRAPGEETPGICGISVLKRSDGGWSVIGLRFDSILKGERVDSRQLKVEGEEERNWSLAEADIPNRRSEAGGRTEKR